MFQLAIQARIPIIRVTTGDVVNLHAVLEHLVDAEVHPLGQNRSQAKQRLKSHEFLFCIGGIEDMSWEEIYVDIANLADDRVVVAVNPDHESSIFFDCGTLPTPRGLLADMLSKCALEGHISDLLRVLAGSTLKEASELVRLAMAEQGELTPQAVAHARRNLPLNLPGLSIVDTDYLHYLPTKEVHWWMQKEGRLFMMNGEVPQAIVPRGILFRGKTGTGKTMAAKYIGHELGLPVYRLDVAAALNKYIGESEGNVQAALNHIETLAPCIFFIDEVEKIFRKEDDSGTSGRILSSLLWWLQEHKSRVLTIMTCNDDSKMPPELTRTGRIDSEFTLYGIKDEEEQLKFILRELKALDAPKECLKFAKGHFFGSTDSSQAALAECARAYLRSHLLHA
jgi:hypothetical protein